MRPNWIIPNLDVALGEKLPLTVSIFLKIWHWAIIILCFSTEDIGMGQHGSADLLKLCYGATNRGNDGLEPEGGNSLFSITVITTAIFSRNRISCETMFMLASGTRSSLVSLWWTVTSSKT